MKHQLHIALLLILLGLGLAPAPVGVEAGAANLSGTWNLEYMGREGPIRMTFVFKQAGENLTGDYTGPFGEHKVTGTVKGNNAVFGFELKSPGADSPFKVTFKGTIESPTRMTGTVGNPFCSAGCKWTGTKKK
jgi:hypothetical protein